MQEESDRLDVSFHTKGGSNHEKDSGSDRSGTKAGLTLV